MSCSHRLSICVLNMPRRYLVTNTKWTCRLCTTLRPRRILGSGSHLGVGGHRYVACYEGPSVSERRAEGAPGRALRPRPIRVEPRTRTTPDVAGLARSHPGLQRPGRAADRGPEGGVVACLRFADCPAAG